MKRGFFALALVLSLLTATAEAFREGPVFRRGDWNSSGGDTMPPYEPPYEFEYDCQAQMNDQIRRIDKAGMPYQHFGVAEVRFTNQRMSANAVDLEWFGKKYLAPEKTSDLEGPLPFAVEGTTFNLYVERSYVRGKSDTVTLSLHLRQKLGEFAVIEHERQEFSRDDAEFELSAYVSVNHATKPDIPRMIMRVLCTKVR